MKPLQLISTHIQEKEKELSKDRDHIMAEIVKANIQLESGFDDYTTMELELILSAHSAYIVAILDECEELYKFRPANFTLNEKEIDEQLEEHFKKLSATLNIEARTFQDMREKVEEYYYYLKELDEKDVDYDIKTLDYYEARGLYFCYKDFSSAEQHDEFYRRNNGSF